MSVPKSLAILRALDAATQPLSTSTIGAEIDEERGRYVSALCAHLRTAGYVTGGGVAGREALWKITEAGREHLTDVLAEQQDDAISAAGAARRVMAAERRRMDPDGPAPARRKPKRRPKASVLNDALAAAGNGTQRTAVVVSTEPPVQSIAVREDGAVLVLEGGTVLTSLSAELALRIAGVVRRMRAEQ